MVLALRSGVVAVAAVNEDLVDRLPKEQRGDSECTGGHVFARAKDGVDDGWDEGGVQAVHWGQGSQHRIGHTLRNDDRRDGYQIDGYTRQGSVVSVSLLFI